MIVKELIKRLEKADPEAEVVINDWDWGADVLDVDIVGRGGDENSYYYEIVVLKCEGIYE